MNYSFLLAATADAWHGAAHGVTGYMVQLLNEPGSNVRQFIDNALVAGAADISGGCDYNTYATAATFPDDIKNSSGYMSNWHWNDIRGHLSYTDGLTTGDIDLVEAYDDGSLIPASKRSVHNATCIRGDDCYGSTRDNGIQQGGQLGFWLKDFQANILKDGTGAGKQGAFPTVSYYRGWAVRHAMHLVADHHLPVHNGSFYSNIGLDQDCCPDTFTLNSDGICSDGTTLLPEVKEDTCSGRKYGRRWCRASDDFDSFQGQAGDIGGNEFRLQFNDGMWGPFRTAGTATQMHYVWDAAFGMFETTTADFPDDAYLSCNEDTNGSLKKFDVVTRTVDSEGALVEESNEYWLNESWGIETYTAPEFDETLYCHAEQIIKDYPSSSIHRQINALISEALLDYYPNGDGPTNIPASFFNPEIVDIDQWQDEMNWLRHWIIYRPFLIQPEGIEGADCYDTGVVAYPTNWWPHSRKIVRAMNALSGYRSSAFLNDVSKDYIASPLQTANGDLKSVCDTLNDKSDSAMASVITSAGLVGLMALLF